MAQSVPLQAVRDLVTKKFFDQQSDENTRRFQPYAFTQGLKKSMQYLSADDVQELNATREFRTGQQDIPVVANSNVSGVFTGEKTSGRDFFLEYDRVENGGFPWKDIQNVLGQPSTIHDIPVRKIVVRFDDEEFESEWRSKLEDAINVSNPSLEWVESPFFAVLSSTDPGQGVHRENVRGAHEDFYYKPDSPQTSKNDGFPWSIATLDLDAVWSFEAWKGNKDTKFTSRGESGSVDWNARKIEKYLMNYFHPESQYAGAMYMGNFVGKWRSAFSRQATSTKVYQWEGDEEWTQLDQTGN